MWELDYKENWELKNWCFWAVALEKTLVSPWDSKEIQPVHPKGNHSWIFMGRTDAEAKTLILWPPDVKNWLFVKTLMLGRLKVGGEGDDRRWDGWMASLTQWTWVWVNSGNWWWTGRPGMLQSMGSQRVRCYWTTELNWSWLLSFAKLIFCVWQDILNEGSSALIRWPRLLHLGHVCPATVAGPLAQTPTLNLNSRPHCLALVIPLDLWTMSNYYKSL